MKGGNLINVLMMWSTTFKYCKKTPLSYLTRLIEEFETKVYVADNKPKRNGKKTASMPADDNNGEK